MGVSHGLALWQVYAMIPDRAQLVVKRWISVMAAGMSQLGEADKQPMFVKRQGIDVLETKLDYNEYCFYVAGTEGALASELVIHQYELTADAATTLHVRATCRGRSLQKTNIVKDFVEDLGRGVCYLPDTWLGRVDHRPLELRGADIQWKAGVISDVLDELHEATDYVLALPARLPASRLRHIAARQGLAALDSRG
jgi:farnesyl-diphosphate farnesyltransferase